MTPAMARTFVAVFPPPSVLDALEDLRRRLEPELTGLRWTRSENLHFTLRFFGDLDRGQIETAAAKVEEVAAAVVPFEIELQGAGVFPDWKRPRVFWVGTGKGGPVLQALARELGRRFEEAGLGPADKPFVPHLTLGRWRDSRNLDRKRAERLAREVGSLGVFPVQEIGVVESRLGRGGSRYTPLYVSSLHG